MSRFSIISKDTGVTLYSGKPTYTGTYMKPGMLEFREVASPVPIAFSAGDYVVYSRTGQTFRLYSTPQIKKQARAGKHGGSFVYQSVQLFDDSKQLELCPFRDLVTGDNRIHFSTQPSISTFEGVDGIARRFQACLDDMYPNTWIVRLATAQDGASQSLLDLMSEAREFTVSGVNLLQALDKVYEIWPEVGWVYRVEGGKNTIVIGGGGLSSTEQFVYGKGNGLRSITRTPANADELANRIFAYGSSRNMLPRWYNSQNIKERESVDIQNLMIPVSEWGLTDVDGVDLPDAAKAYVEDAQSIAKIGLRPKTIYFDGSGEYPEIYPSLRNVTIGDIRNAMDSSDEYYPTQASNSKRVDKIAVAQPEFDSGLAGDIPGKTRVSIDTRSISQSATTTASAGISHFPIYHYQGDYTPTETGNYDLSAILSLSGTVAVSGIENVEVSIELRRPEYQGGSVLGNTLFFKPTADGVVTLSNGSLRSSNVQLTNNTYILTIDIYVNLSAPETDIVCTYNFSGDFSISVENYRSKTFWVSIEQIGFDISEQAALGDGKVLAMRSGKCAGRSFVIDSVRYDSRNDMWMLTVIRSEDESLSQWFPNEDYPIEIDDEFVLLDIAMPGLYVHLAEQRLLAAAREVLSDTAVERWQYVPEIDAEFMIESGRVITAGQNMAISDADIIGDSPVAIMVDSISINEGESTIPTYKVTLRDRKRRTFTESQSPESISSVPVTKNSSSGASESNSSSGSVASFFMLDEDGNVTLKPQYQNLWVPGWLSAGGVQDGESSGGGGLITSVKGVNDLGTAISTESLTETFSAKAIESIYEAVLALQQATPNVSLSNGNAYSTITVNGTSAQFYTKDQVDLLIGDVDLSDYGASLSLTKTTSAVYLKDATGNYVLDSTGKRIALGGQSTTTSHLNLLNKRGNILSTVDLDIDFDLSRYAERSWVTENFQEKGNYITSETDPTVPAWAKTQNLAFSALPLLYIGKSSVQSSAQDEALDGILSIKCNASNSLIEWESSNSAWHFHGNVYADGWIAAGGVQDGESGGGGGSSIDLDAVWQSLTNNTDKPNVKINLAHIPDITTSMVSNLSSWIGSSSITTLGDVTSGSIRNSAIQYPYVTVAGIQAYLGGEISVSALKTALGISGDETPTISNVILTNGAEYSTITVDDTAASFYTKSQVDGLIPTSLSAFSGDATHRVVTDTQISAWNAKSDFSGSYNDLTNKPSIPTESTVLGWGFTKNAGTITGIRMNGLSMGSSGEVDLGTVITEHQSLSNYVTLDSSQTITGAKTFSANLTASANLLVGGTVSVNGLNSIDQSNATMSLFNFGARTSKTFNAYGIGCNLRAIDSNGNEVNILAVNSGATLVGKTLRPNYNATVNLGANTTDGGRWANIYGVNADLTGNLSLSSASYFDLGPIRIAYDSTENALHVTSNDNSTINLYCDGYIAAGGSQASS